MRHSFIKFFGIILAAILFTACSNEAAKTEASAFSLDDTKAQIEASNKVFGASYATGDSTAFANCYTSDGCIYFARMPQLCGSAALKAFFNEGHNSGINNIVLTSTEIMGGKDAVMETGKYEVFVGNNISAEKGKYIVIWKEENGKWKMYRDIWNSDAPPPPLPSQEGTPPG